MAADGSVNVSVSVARRWSSIEAAREVVSAVNADIQLLEDWWFRYGSYRAFNALFTELHHAVWTLASSGAIHTTSQRPQPPPWRQGLFCLHPLADEGGRTVIITRGRAVAGVGGSVCHAPPAIVTGLTRPLPVTRRGVLGRAAAYRAVPGGVGRRPGSTSSPAGQQYRRVRPSIDHSQRPLDTGRALSSTGHTPNRPITLTPGTGKTCLF